MSTLKLLIVEGNTKKENFNFSEAGCVSQSENFRQHIKKLEPNCEVDITEPASLKLKFSFFVLPSTINSFKVLIN
jgi:hypothetical protein